MTREAEGGTRGVTIPESSGAVASGGRGFPIPTMALAAFWGSRKTTLQDESFSHSTDDAPYSPKYRKQSEELMMSTPYT